MQQHELWLHNDVDLLLIVWRLQETECDFFMQLDNDKALLANTVLLHVSTKPAATRGSFTYIMIAPMGTFLDRVGTGLDVRTRTTQLRRRGEVIVMPDKCDVEGPEVRQEHVRQRTCWAGACTPRSRRSSST